MLRKSSKNNWFKHINYLFHTLNIAAIQQQAIVINSIRSSYLAKPNIKNTLFVEDSIETISTSFNR